MVISSSFSKLMSSITESTVWMEPDGIRIVWITMLAMADFRGRVWASIPGLAHRARVSIEVCQQALEKFKSPDPFSRTKKNEGRRVEDIDGGWILLNYEDYRNLRNSEEEKARKREWWRENRGKGSTLDDSLDTLANLDQTRPNKKKIKTLKDSCASATAELDARDSGFDAFWSEYPKKKSKGQALKAWKKIKAAEREAIMGGLARAKRSRQWLKDNGEYIPYPATWLNARGWEDEDASPDQGHAPKVTSDLPSRETLLRDEYMAHERHPLVDEFYRAAKEDQSIEIDFQAWVEARND